MGIKSGRAEGGPYLLTVGSSLVTRNYGIAVLQVLIDEQVSQVAQTIVLSTGGVVQQRSRGVRPAAKRVGVGVRVKSALRNSAIREV